MTSSMAASTPSQLRPTIAAMLLHRLPPDLPANSPKPALTLDSVGLPLKNFVTVGSSHTVPTDDTMASVLATFCTDSSVGFSASSSSRPTRSNWWFSSASSRCADASVSAAQPGCSVRSLSVSLRTNATRSAALWKPKRSSPLPRNASHSSPPSRQRGAQSV